jgi:hypothetical protein
MNSDTKNSVSFWAGEGWREWLNARLGIETIMTKWPRLKGTWIRTNIPCILLLTADARNTATRFLRKKLPAGSAKTQSVQEPDTHAPNTPSGHVVYTLTYVLLHFASSFLNYSVSKEVKSS